MVEFRTENSPRLAKDSEPDLPDQQTVSSSADAQRTALHDAPVPMRGTASRPAVATPAPEVGGDDDFSADATSESERAKVPVSFRLELPKDLPE
jgi:hypothetical protein